MKFLHRKKLNWDLKKVKVSLLVSNDNVVPQTLIEEWMNYQEKTMNG